MKLPAEFSNGTLTQVQGGLINSCYRLHLPRGDFFLRVSSPHAGRLGIQRDREFVLHKLAADHGLAPRLHFMDIDQGLMITDWIAPTAMPLEWRSPAGVELLAETAAKVHVLPAPELPLDLVAHLYFYLARICNRDPILLQLFNIIVKRLEQLPAVPAVVCHNDISPANMLGYAPLLADWEYAGVGDPAFDLAVMIRAFELNDKQAIQLLTAYREQGGNCSLERVLVMCSVADFVALLWARVFCECSDDPRYPQMANELTAKLCKAEKVAR